MTATVAGDQSDIQAVAALPQRLAEAWRAKDAAAFADIFTEDGTVILAGAFCAGRAAIRDFIAAAFAGPYADTQVVGVPVQVRPIADDVVLVLTDGGICHGGETEVAPANAVRGSWLAVRRDGAWSLAAYQNTAKHGA